VPMISYSPKRNSIALYTYMLPIQKVSMQKVSQFLINLCFSDSVSLRREQKLYNLIKFIHFSLEAAAALRYNTV